MNWLMVLLKLLQDGYAVVAADGPGEYPVITESRAGNDAVGVTVIPGTVAYVTTGGSTFEDIFILDSCVACNLMNIYCVKSHACN